MRNACYIFLIVILSSCGQKSFDSKEDMLAFLKNPDNGYYQEKTVNGVQFSLLYKPTDLLVSQEVLDNPTQSEVDSLRAKYDKYAYFNLSMSKNGRELLTNKAGNREAFGKLVNTIAFGIEKQVFLLNAKKDTIYLSDYIYPRQYGMTNHTSLLLAYQKEKIINNSEIKFTIKDLGFNTGDVSIKFKIEDLNNEPYLEL